MSSARGLAVVAGLVLPVVAAGVCRADLVFQQTNLVSSVPGLAPATDANLADAWGVAASATGPSWVANRATGTATLYNGGGVPQALVVTIPPAAGSPAGTPGSPTGLVFNPTNDFQIPPLAGGSPARFLFATRDGTLAGWTGGTSAIRQVDNGASGASYTGLALASSGGANFLYAANHGSGSIDVFNGNFAPASGFSFNDPTLPAGFAAYNIQNLGGTLYVTYRNATSGGGFVDAFSADGAFLRRIAGGGPLDSPWGLALAPADFGPFGGALLVGNEGDGRISAFNPLSGQFLGQLLDAQGRPLANPGLHGLLFGNGGNGGDPGTLYFAAGIRGGSQGLFGSIRVAAVPEPASALLLGPGGLALLAVRRARCRGGRVAPRGLRARRTADLARPR